MFLFHAPPPFFPFYCQIDLMLRGLLGLFDKAVKPHHAAPLYTEKNQRNLGTWQATPDLLQFAAQ